MVTYVHEAYIPTKKEKTPTKTWIFGSDRNTCGSSCASGAPPPWQSTTKCKKECVGCTLLNMSLEKHRAPVTHFRGAFKKGNNRHSKNFSIRVSQVSTPSVATVVVSKKVIPTAVGRNKLKRRVREVLARVSLPKNKNIILYAKKGAATLKTERIRGELLALMSN